LVERGVRNALNQELGSEAIALDVEMAGVAALRESSIEFSVQQAADVDLLVDRPMLGLPPGDL
jgi:hypothetical protein